MKFSGYIYVFVFIALVMAPLFQLQAQNSKASDALGDGSRALQFRVGENFSLTSFSGTVFSYKRHISAERANRIGLSLGNSYSNTAEIPENEDQSDLDRLNIALSAQYTWMHYTNPEADIKHYFGYGPGLNFQYNFTSRDDENFYNKDRDLGVGLYGLAYTGLEWFFHSSISLHAEYAGSVRINRGWNRNIRDNKQTTEEERVDRRNTTSFRISGDGVRFGISVYF